MIHYCPQCGKPVADDCAFCPNCGASLKAAQPVPSAQPAQPAQPTPQTQPTNRFAGATMNAAPENHGPKPDNHLVLAIVTAVLCCMPLGIWAIVLASKVDGLWNSGQYAEAKEKADKAKTISIVGMVLGFLYVIIYAGIVIASEM